VGGERESEGGWRRKEEECGMRKGMPRKSGEKQHMEED